MLVKVAHPEGISLEMSPGRIPTGTVLAVPIQPIHYDEEIYPDASKFEPFRFVKEGGVGNIFDSFDGTEKTRAKAQSKSTATLDDAFLGFGFGKHACPGRFFALNEIKVFVAHMLLNYEIEHREGRPQLIDMMWLKLPFHNGNVRVRYIHP